jgi:hypothetical protein
MAYSRYHILTPDFKVSENQSPQEKGSSPMWGAALGY